MAASGAAPSQLTVSSTFRAPTARTRHTPAFTRSAEALEGRIHSYCHRHGLNPLLCELTADTCRREVVAGPVEATAIGNLLIQARTMADLPADKSIRDISAASSELQVYLPRSD